MTYRPQKTADNPIAIVGLGGVFPDAIDVQGFWANIVANHVAIRDVPKHRWDPELFWSSERTEPDKTYSKIGGFLRDEHMAFDSRRFRIPPKTLRSIDTVQQLAVRATAEALSDAGLKSLSQSEEGREFDRDRAAVILGNAMGGTYEKQTVARSYFPQFERALHDSAAFRGLPDATKRELLADAERGYKADFPPITEDTMPGELSNCVAGRVANALDLRGTNFTTDAACAASMAALKSAMDGLRLGQFDIAIAGGADQMVDPSAYIKFAKIGALSADHSVPFDARANGFVMGEGVGILILKRLDDAERDGDRIYAVIRGIGAASDGRGKGMTAPNPRGQRLAVQAAYQDADLPIDAVGLFEAHGTSTVVGDSTEVGVLTELLKNTGSAPRGIPLGSVKSMIGHLKAAAGAASLIKTALALHHRVLPPSAGFEQPASDSPLLEGYLAVNTEARPWESAEIRRAGVSAFGFGGTNAHAVLEEYRKGEVRVAEPPAENKRKTTSVAVAGEMNKSMSTKSNDTLLNEVIAMFAEATGYEVADLEPDYDLEADLGIDTVKQAEVFSDLRERYGLATEEDFRLSQVPTLRAVADYVAQRSGVSTQGSEGIAPPSAAGQAVLASEHVGSSDANPPADAPRFDGWEVLCFGGESAEGTARSARAALADSRWPPTSALLGARSATRRQMARLAFAANDIESARKKADSAGKRNERVLNAQGIFSAVGESLASKGSVAFVFPGQGSQFLGMYRDLAELFPVVRETFEEADRVLGPLIGSTLTAYTWADFSNDEERAAAELRLRQTEICQPAMLTADIAMFRLLGTFGLKPSMVVGHSLGEYAACVAASVMTFAEALYAVSARGREMAHIEVEDNGKMASVAAGADRVEPMLAEIDGYVIAANKNCHAQTVIAGASSSVEAAVEKFSAVGIDAREIPVSHAFHSAIVAPASVPLKNALRSLDIKAPKIPILSNVHAGFYPDDKEAIIELLGRQLESPVEFISQIESMYDKGARVFIECGPRRAATGFVRNVLGNEREYQAVATNHHKRPAIEPLMGALALMASEGVEIDFEARQPDPLRESVSAGANSVTPTPAAGTAVTGTAVAPSVSGRAAEGGASRPVMTPEHVSAPATGFRAVVASGVSLIPPVADPLDAMDGSNFDRMLSGENMIHPVGDQMRQAMVDKNVVRLEKATGEFTRLRELSDVIQLAARTGEVDLVESYGIDANFDDALDRVSRLTIAAGIDALRDAGLPLIRHYRTTSTGKKLPDRFGLPDALAERTGVIVGSAFTSLDRVIEDVSQHVASKQARKTRGQLEQLLDRLTGVLRDPDERASARRLAEPWLEELQNESELYTFSRKFLFRTLAMAHAQLAHAIVARGPNAHVNAACASGTLGLSVAQDWLRLGRCDRVVLVGADDVTDDTNLPFIGAGFLAAGAATTESDVTRAAIPFGAQRNGMILGSGAAGIVLEYEDDIRQRGLEPIVELVDTRSANSAFHGTRLNTSHIAKHVRSFVDGILEREGGSREELASKTFFMSHETYTPARGGSSQAEVDALRAAFGNAVDQVVIANTKGQTGHPMGANLEDAVAIKGLQRQVLPAVAHLNEIDPEFAELRFSRGGKHEAKYALHLAAGFGSQLNLAFFKQRATTEARLFDAERYHAWLDRIAGSGALLEVTHRTLRVAESGGSRVDELGLPSLQRTSATLGEASPTARSASQVQLDRDVLLKEITTLFAEQSGYDVGDFEPGYELEADLGIDTVKQAEIFSVIRERYGFPADDSFRLADVPTLDAVVDYVIARVSETPVPVASSAASEASPAALVGELSASPSKETAHPDRAPLLAELTALFAEQSGYDPNDLDPAYDLEADLGIDTVKQAEIFTTIRTRYGLPNDDDFKLSAVQSLNAVVEYVMSFTGDSSPLPPVGSQASAPPSEARTHSPKVKSSEATATQPSRDGDRTTLLAEITQLFAQESGYELSDLEPAYELEADLGIDTVKQAEILSTLRERYALPADDTFRLSDVPTLNAVVDYVRDQLGRSEEHRSSGTSSAGESSGIASASGRDGTEPRPDRAKLLTEITALFAEESGYDVDDLDSSYALEADLGIDTVKQAEIFSVLRERYQLPRDEDFKLSEVQSLTAVVDYVISQLERGESKRLGKPQSATSQPWVAEARFEARSTEAITLGEPQTELELARGRHVVLVGGDDAFRQAVRESLLAVGANVHALGRGRLDAESVRARLVDLGGHPADDVVVLGPETLSDFDAVRTVLGDAFEVARGFGNVVGASGRRLVFASRTDGVFGMGSRDPASWVIGGLSGLAKSLAKEWPDSRVVTIDLDRHESLSVAAGQVVAEAYGSGPGEIAYRSGRRLTLRRAQTPYAPSVKALRHEALIVATGGARGVTFEIVRELCRRSTLRVVLVGRTEPLAEKASVLYGRDEAAQKQVARDALSAAGERVTPVAIQRFLERERGRIEVHRNIEALRALNATVEMVSADLSAQGTAERVGLELRQRFGVCDVLLHGSGREESKMLVDKTRESFESTYAPKTDAFFALYRALKPRRSALMGSIAGRFGNAGQADYALGNEVLSAFARSAPDVLCLNWTAWGDVGMATKHGVQKVLRESGVDFLPASTGAAIGADLISSELSGDVVIAGALGEIARDEMVAGATPSALEPWFDSSWEQDEESIFEVCLDPKSVPGLDHHRLDGVALLPGVLGVELMAQAVSAQSGKPVRVIEDVDFRVPLKFHRDHPMTIRVAVSQEDASGSRAVVLRSLFEGPNGKTIEREHFSCRVFVGSLSSPSLPPARAIHLPHSPAIERGAIYERYFHGPSFQVLEAPTTLGEDGITGSTVSEWQEWLPSKKHADFMTSPFAREAGFQTSGLWEMVELGRMALPSAIERIQLGEPTSSDERLVVEARRVGSDAQGASFDVWVRSETGHVRDVMTGYRTVVLRTLGDDERFESGGNGHPAPDWLWVNVEEIEAELDRDPTATLERFLSPSERTRFHGLKTRKRSLEWLAGRIAAKRLIREVHFSGEGALVGYPAITVDSNSLGAPEIRIVGEKGEEPRISISHSDGMAAAMLARDPACSPGIDIEAVESRSAAFVRDYFTEKEREQIAASEAERDVLVTAIWAVKEATLKALGIGARVDLRQIDVVIRSDETPMSGSVEFHGEALERARQLGAKTPEIAIERHGRRMIARVLLPIAHHDRFAQGQREAPL